MKKILSFMLVAIMVLAFTVGCGDSTPQEEEKEIEDLGQSTYTHEQLVWSDEFNGDELNLTNWKFDIGGGGWGNQEEQYYTDSNHTVGNGYLTITAKEDFTYGTKYTSTRIKSQGLQSFTYGRMEAKISLPAGSGFWPAFWMLSEPIEGSSAGSTESQYGTWPACGEIDIMEAQGRLTDATSCAIHYGSVEGQDGGYVHQYKHASYPMPSGESIENWHVYAVEWSEGLFKFYVDDLLFAKYDSKDWYTGGDLDNANAPFDQEFYFILNLAVGGTFDNFATPKSEDLPGEMKVDYVRVYSTDYFM